jgi:hypothetical protein
MGTVGGRPERGVRLVLLGVMGFLFGHPVAAQQVRYSGSVAYSTGSYVFADRTHSLWLSSSLSVSGGPFSFTASLQVIAQNSGVVSFVAGQPLPTGGEGSGAVGSRGQGRRIGSRGSGTGSTSADSTVVFRDRYEVQVGDPMLWTAAELYSGTGRLRSVSLQASAKPPLRSLESGVGTGQWDFGGGASLVGGVGRTLVLLDGSYWSFGDLPDLELAGSFLYSVGVSRAVMDARGSVLVSLYGATSIMETVDAPLSAGAAFFYSVSEGRSVTASANVGLSEASPDFAFSIGWGVRLR